MGKWSKSVRVLFLVMLGSLLVDSRADKDSSGLLLRPPSAGSSGSGPVFSASIDSLPKSSATTNREAVFKNPNYIHSSASASASGGGNDDQASAGRNNSPWYNSGGNSNSGFSYDFNGGSETGGGGNAQQANAAASTGNSFYDSPPAASSHQAASASAISSESYGAPGGGPGGPGHHGPAYTYFYQHYPTTSNHGGGGGSGWSAGGEDSGPGHFLGDFSLPGLSGFGGLGGAGGVGGVKVAKVAAAIIKGIAVAKPIILIALLLLITIPVLLFLAPIPIITITQQPGLYRQARAASEQFTSYLTQLSGKVLNAEECLERIICKMPQAPEKYQNKAKMIWNEHGSKLVTNQRFLRGLNAYFDTSSQKNRNLKCEQKFKCSNKYL